MSKVAQSGSSQFSRDETLAFITQATKDCIPGVDSVSISVRESGGVVRTLAPTDELSLKADLAQYDVGEGPCVDVSGGQQMIYSGHIEGDPRYPQYGPRAAGLGVVSQLAFEMYTGDRKFGGLNLYSRSDNVFDDEARSIAELFAHQGAIALGHAATIREYNEALASRKVIGQAIGIIMERYQVDENGAFGFLTRMSQTSNVKLRVVAADVVASSNDKLRHASDD